MSLIDKARIVIGQFKSVEKISSNREKEYVALISDLTSELERCHRLFESLTPGGSEYYGDPDRCAEHITDRFRSDHQIIIKFKRQADQAKVL